MLVVIIVADGWLTAAIVFEGWAVSLPPVVPRDTFDSCFLNVVAVVIVVVVPCDVHVVVVVVDVVVVVVVGEYGVSWCCCHCVLAIEVFLVIDITVLVFWIEWLFVAVASEIVSIAAVVVGLDEVVEKFGVSVAARFALVAISNVLEVVVVVVAAAAVYVAVVLITIMVVVMVRSIRL